MREVREYRRIVLLSSGEKETGRLRDTLSREAELATVWSREELFGLLQGDTFDAFLCDWDFEGGRWREVCREVKRSYPGLPILLLCRVCPCGGEKEWVEVLGAGCFDLLCAPFSNRQVLSALEHAVASRAERDLLEIVA